MNRTLSFICYGPHSPSRGRMSGMFRPANSADSEVNGLLLLILFSAAAYRWLRGGASVWPKGRACFSSQVGTQSL